MEHYDFNTAPAVVLLSGGLDSATTAAIARADGYRLFALSVDYGQRHRFELDAAAVSPSHSASNGMSSLRST